MDPCAWPSCHNPPLHEKRYCGRHIGLVIAAVRREFMCEELNQEYPASRPPASDHGTYRRILSNGTARIYKKADR